MCVMCRISNVFLRLVMNTRTKFPKQTFRFGLGIFLYVMRRDLKPKRAWSVKKTVLWTVFSEQGVKAGTERKALGRRAGKVCASKISSRHSHQKIDLQK